MTRAPSHLQLMRRADLGADDSSDTHDTDTAPALTQVAGTGPDDGRLAHPATRRRGSTTPSHHEAEARVVGHVADLLQAPRTAVGRVVAGGVEEAAVLVLRGARDARPGLRHGSVVLPSSAHPAWFAAAATVGLTPLVVPVDFEGRAPLGPTAAAIRDDTVLVVASAPGFTHGTVDPVGWIAAAAQAREVPLHVDASSGGWALAYAERDGRVGPSWGFAVGGVGSVSIDVGPESGRDADLVVVLHREAAGARGLDLARRRGPVALPATWTRPSALLADVAETLAELGHDGCADLAGRALATTTRVVAGLSERPGVQVVACPDATTVALRADASCDVLTVADGLHARGWSAHPVLQEAGPMLLRLPVTAAMADAVEELLAAVDEAVAEAQDQGRQAVDPTLARLLHRLEPGEVADATAHLLLDAAATLDAADAAADADAGRPEGRAATHRLLAAAVPGVREPLLSVHRERLVRPVRPTGRPAGQPATSASTEANE